MTLKLSGFCGVKPASASNALPFAGSKVYLFTGLPKATARHAGRNWSRS